jgi:hypothetical protein
MIWPGGATPIERLPFVPNGLTTPFPRTCPRRAGGGTGESGRGFFIEWQNNNAHIAGYMYDAAGNPVWYLSRDPWTDPRRYSGPWLRFGNGQAPGGPYRRGAAPRSERRRPHDRVLERDHGDASRCPTGAVSQLGQAGILKPGPDRARYLARA